jgi:hypothetical protein
MARAFEGPGNGQTYVAVHAVYGAADAVGHPVFHGEHHIDRGGLELYSRALRPVVLELSDDFTEWAAVFFAVLGHDPAAYRRFRAVDFEHAPGAHRRLAARALRQDDAGKLAQNALRRSNTIGIRKAVILRK